MDKVNAIIEYLMQMPYIQDNPLFFNFADAEDNNKQLTTLANDIAINKPFIDGSIQKMFTFTIIDFKSVTYNPLVNVPGYSNENVDDMLEVQSIIDWVTTQNKIRNFPNFGDKCSIDKIEALSTEPNLNGVDTSLTPSLAKYSVSIRVTYVDMTESIL